MLGLGSPAGAEEAGADEAEETEETEGTEEAEDAEQAGEEAEHGEGTRVPAAGSADPEGATDRPEGKTRETEDETPETEDETPETEDETPETEDETSEPKDAVSGGEEIEVDAVEILHLARLDYDRGDFQQAAAGFASILSSPVRLDTREDLHEGFLYYAFTLFLQGEDGGRKLAEERLRYALRLDPDYVPSAVTTRPDLLQFYTAQRNAFIMQSGSIAEPPEIVFPELQRGRETTRIMRRRRFVPVFGRGLHFLGHRKAAAGLLSTELALAGVNVATFVLRLALVEDVSPAGWEATRVARYTNYASFGLFWGVFVVDFVVSMVLQRRYRLHPEIQPTLQARTPPRRPRPPRLTATQGGLGLAFW